MQEKGGLSARPSRLGSFARFTATQVESDFSFPCIIGFGSSPSRCGPLTSRAAKIQNYKITKITKLQN